MAMFLKYLTCCLEWNRDIYCNDNKPEESKGVWLGSTEYKESNIEEQNFEGKSPKIGKVVFR